MNEAIQEILTRVHNIEHKLDLILGKMRLSDMGDEGDDHARMLSKMPPTLPQDPRVCGVCNNIVAMNTIAMTPSQFYDAKGNMSFGYKRMCACKITQASAI